MVSNMVISKMNRIIMFMHFNVHYLLIWVARSWCYILSLVIRFMILLHICFFSGQLYLACNKQVWICYVSAFTKKVGQTRRSKKLIVVDITTLDWSHLNTCGTIDVLDKHTISFHILGWSNGIVDLKNLY